MRIALVSAIGNEAGLAVDLTLLKNLAESAGHEVAVFHHRKPKPETRFDLVIFVEIYVHGWGDLAPVRWWCPNAEWISPGWTSAIPMFDRILCKTRDARRIFTGLGGKTILVGFASEDRLNPSIKRERRFLHIAGDSMLKGTGAVIEAWERFRIPYPLTVVTRKYRPRRQPKGIQFKFRLAEGELRALQNQCTFHLAPSEYEGWGHVIHEALSVGAVLATTDAPPMSEFIGAHLLVPATPGGQHGLVTRAQVTPKGISEAVQTMWAMSFGQVDRAGTLARQAFEVEGARFRANFLMLLEDLGRSATIRRVPLRKGGQMSATAVRGWGDGRVPSPTSESPQNDSQAHPRISIVFPVGEPGLHLLKRSLLALQGQTAPVGSFEVVVAVDGRDLEEVQPFVPHTEKFHTALVASPRPRGDVPHRNHARNAGWRVAKGDICWMLDSDFILPPHAIEHLLIEHDIAMAKGSPAVFSPCLTGVGYKQDSWLSASALWAETESPILLQNLMEEAGKAGDIYSGFPERFVPGAPSSEPLPNLPEGQPALWRGLLELMGGFDEEFGEWGGDKEEFIDRLKGLARAGLFEIRLLTSVMAWHQPHARDPGHKAAGVKKRQREREKRAKLILANAPWWKIQAVSITAGFQEVLDSLPPPPPIPVIPPVETEPPPVLFDHHASALAAETVLRLVQHGKAGGPVLVVGRHCSAIAHALRVAGAEATAVQAAGLSAVHSQSFRRIATIDVLAGPARNETAAQLRRIVSHSAQIIAFELTRMNAHAGHKGLLPNPIDIQHTLPGLTVKTTCSDGSDTWTVFLGRLTR